MQQQARLMRITNQPRNFTYDNGSDTTYEQLMQPHIDLAWTPDEHNSKFPTVRNSRDRRPPSIQESLLNTQIDEDIDLQRDMGPS